MPDNRQVCAKCGEIYGEPYAQQCSCFYAAQEREENPNLGYKEPELNVKDTNPKDAVGTKKVPISVLPFPVLGEVALALLEGARKYGRHNWRVAGVRASVYIDAVIMRHLGPFWEGEDIDPDSGLNHITKAIAGLTVLRDSMIQGNWVDDRPPKSPNGWKDDLNKKTAIIIEKYPNALEPYTQLGIEKDEK